MKTAYKIAFGTLLTKRVALLMSICYLINPIYQPLSVILHEVVSSLESPNKVIGHINEFGDDENIYRTNHDHNVMDLHQGHKLINLINTFFENSENDKNSDQSLADIIKIDKHLTSSIQLLTHNAGITSPLVPWMTHQNIRNGHPIKCKEPPISS